MVEIDETDKNILRHLQSDSSISLEELGQKVALSRNACWRRIRTMDKAGLIKKRVALLDPDALDLGLSVFILVRTSSHDATWLNKFAAATRAMPEILGAYRMTGDLDYLIRARVRDVGDYDRLYRKLISRVDMSDVSASFVMEELKETTELPI